MSQEHVNRTSYAFTASNERADAIGLVASGYSDNDIVAEVLPIRTPDQASEALARTMRRMGELQHKLHAEDLERVRERFAQLGETGTASMVELLVPAGGQNFDWGVFYDQIETYL